MAKYGSLSREYLSPAQHQRELMGEMKTGPWLRDPAFNSVIYPDLVIPEVCKTLSNELSVGLSLGSRQPPSLVPASLALFKKSMLYCVGNGKRVCFLLLL